jgi:CRP/FNR family transcriptional regulator
MVLPQCTGCRAPCVFSGERGRLLSSLKRINTLHYEKGEAIFEQGEPVSGFYVLCRGRVKEGWRTSLGSRRTLRLSARGGLLALAEALTGQFWHRTYAVALEESQLLFIGREELRTLRRDPELLFELTLRLAQEIALLKGGLELASYGVRERIAGLLLAMGSDPGQQDGQEQELGIDFPLTNEELAELAGCSPISVSRTLNEFKRRGFLKRSHQGIKILDEQGLRSLAAEVLISS